MGFADSILHSHDQYINETRDLLARRLRGPDLLRSIDIAKFALSELGGGPHRVEQRLRSTLAWCRSSSSLLSLRSSHAEIAAAHVSQPRNFRGSAASHHMHHLDRVRNVAAEIRLPTHERKGLFNYVLALAKSARCLELQNTSAFLDAKKPLPYRRNLIAADGKRRAESAKEIRNKTFCAFNALMQKGWLVDANTITLPSSFHSATSHRMFGLAGSPDWRIAADLLRKIRSKGDLKGVKTFWRIEAHPEEMDTLHLHMICAYLDSQARDQHHRKLGQVYARLTYKYWSLNVVGGFGISCPPFSLDDGSWDHSKGPIYVDQMAHESQLLETVMYIGAVLKPSLKTVPGHSYGHSGKLFVEQEEAPQKDYEKVIRIKIYQGGASAQKTSSAKEVLCQHRPTTLTVIGFTTTNGRPCILWSRARGPPIHLVQHLLADLVPAFTFTPARGNGGAFVVSKLIQNTVIQSFI